MPTSHGRGKAAVHRVLCCSTFIHARCWGVRERVAEGLCWDRLGSAVLTNTRPPPRPQCQGFNRKDGSSLFILHAQRGLSRAQGGSAPPHVVTRASGLTEASSPSGRSIWRTWLVTECGRGGAAAGSHGSHPLLRLGSDRRDVCLEPLGQKSHKPVPGCVRGAGSCGEQVDCSARTGVSASGLCLLSRCRLHF